MAESGEGTRKQGPRVGRIISLGLIAAFLVTAALTLADLPIWGLSLGASIVTLVFLYAMYRTLRR